jgi:hypothetical protein
MSRSPDIVDVIVRRAVVALLLGACLRAAVAQAEERPSDGPPIVVEVHAATWLRLELEEPGALSFTLPLFRPSLTVSAFGGRLLAYVRPELAGGDPRLLDAYVDMEHGPALRVRAGRFKTPFSRLWTTSTTSLELPDRGIVVDEFAAGRALGAMASGRPIPELRYDLGVFGAETATGRIAPMIVARFDLTAYGSVADDQTPSLSEGHPSGLSIALNGYYRAGTDGAAPSVTGGLDAQLAEGPFTALTELFVREDLVAQGALAFGAVAQASVFVIPRWTEIIVRGSWLFASCATLEHTYEVGITTHFPVRDVAPGEHVKLTARYRFSAADGAHDAILQAQLAF